MRDRNVLSLWIVASVAGVAFLASQQVFRSWRNPLAIALIFLIIFILLTRWWMGINAKVRQHTPPLQTP